MENVSSLFPIPCRSDPGSTPTVNTLLSAIIRSYFPTVDDPREIYSLYDLRYRYSRSVLCTVSTVHFKKAMDHQSKPLDCIARKDHVNETHSVALNHRWPFPPSPHPDSHWLLTPSMFHHPRLQPIAFFKDPETVGRSNGWVGGWG